MIDDYTTKQWVPVVVPVELVPDVLRTVLSFLEEGRTAADPGEWSDATAEDMAVFFRDVSPLEWQLVAELARRETPTPVAELAEALGVEMGAVAGAMGPVNKRAKREGWGPPIQPRRFTPSGSSTSRRGLVLAAGLRAWVSAQSNGRPSDMTPQMTAGP